MGQAIMIGWLSGVAVIVVVLVLRFDPEARRNRADRAADDGGDGA